MPVEALEEEIVSIRRSFRRIFTWSIVLSLAFTLIMAFGPFAQFPAGQRIGFTLFFLVAFTYGFSSFAFGFKAVAQESGCLAFMYVAFGDIGACIAAMFIGPFFAPFQAFHMWRHLRRCEARLAELRG